MKGEDVDQRHAAAYHVAGQAVMAFYLGGWVNEEGVGIDERRYCGVCLPSGHDAQAKERFLLLCDLAGWRAEHLWHGKGSSRDGYPDEELFAVLEDRRQGWDDYDGDDADAVDAMIKRSPAATDEMAQRYSDYSAECYAILREPAVWSAIERIAAKLIESGKLSAAEALAAVGGDAATLHPLMARHCPLSSSRTKILCGTASLAFNDALWPAMFLPQSDALPRGEAKVSYQRRHQLRRARASSNLSSSSLTRCSAASARASAALLASASSFSRKEGTVAPCSFDPPAISWHSSLSVPRCDCVSGKSIVR